MLVRDRMSSKVVVVRPGESLAKARELLRRHRFRQLFVASGKRLVGIVTDRDLRGVLPTAKTVGQVMTANPVVIAPDASVDEAAGLLRGHKINALPVMDKSKLVGVLTVTDVLTAFIDISGVGELTYRLVIATKDGKRANTLIRELVERNYGEVKWMHHERKRALLHVRIKARSIGDVLAALEAAGFEVRAVVAPPRQSP